MGGMRLGLLGTLEVTDHDGTPVDIRGAQARIVLGVLLSSVGRVVPADALIDAVWGEDPPLSAVGTLQSYVSRLRRALGDGAATLHFEPPGYRLEAPVDSVDFRRFETLADAGHEALLRGDPEAARAALVDGEALWRGPALLEFADRPFAIGVASRLEERRLAAIEDRFDADLQLGRHGVIIGELAEVVAAHPLRERLWAQLALARYRAGHQAEALRALADARRTLRDELGIDPSAALLDLEKRILDQDPGLDLPPDRRAPDAPAGAAPAATAAMAPPASPPKRLIGRAPELAILGDVLAAAREGSARMVVIEGEPGIGKTRLAEAVAAAAAEAQCRVAWGRSLEGGAAPAFWPWLAVLRSIGAAEAGDDSVARLLAPATGEGSAIEDILPSPVRFTLFDAVADALAGAARPQGLVVVLDDIQWADHASLELLSFLAGRLDAEPVLLVATVRELDIGRDDALVSALAAVARRPGSRRIALRGLAGDETSELLTQETGRPVAPDVADAIHARAGGNPFYAGELARLLVEHLDDAAALSGVPSGVRDVVRQRLARLPATTQELLQVGALIGRDVDVSLLAAATEQRLDDVYDGLEPAVVHRLLIDADDRPGAFRFSHALVREVLAEDLTTLKRARSHLRIADAIEARGGGDDDAEILAEHLWAAARVGGGTRAADALEVAAEVAIRRFAVEAADDLYERSLQLRRTMGTDPAHAAAEVDTMMRLIVLRRSRFGYTWQSPLFARARELARRAGRSDLLIEITSLEWTAADVACDFARSRPLARELLAAAQESDDPGLRLNGFHAWAIQCWHDGDIAAARENFDLALAGADVLGVDDRGLSHPRERVILVGGFRQMMVEWLEDPPDADARFRRLVASGDRYAMAFVGIFAGCAAAMTFDAPRAIWWGQSLVAAEEGELFFFGTQARMNLGWALVAAGDVVEGQALFDQAAKNYEAAGVHTGLPLYIADMAISLLRQGYAAEAKQYAVEARRERDEYGEVWSEGAVLLAEAHIAHAGGEDVSESVRRAHTIATAQRIRPLVRRIEADALTLGVDLGSPAGV